MSTPHIKVQLTLDPGESCRVELDLPHGGYRIRTLEPGDDVQFEWRGGGFSEVVLTEDAIAARATGPEGGLSLLNHCSHRRTLIVEERRWLRDALTAKRATALQVFRDLFDDEVLRPGDDVEIDYITIMFTDLKGSTALYERVGDPQAYALVRQHFAILGQAVGGHDGAVVKTIGDAIMAVFVNPRDALLCGLRIHADIEAFNAGSGKDRVSLAMRLAFATQFMAPRLTRLKAMLPGVGISIVTVEQNPRALLDSVDLAVVLGAEPQPELEADFLFSEEIFPVCSPQYLREHPGLRTVDDIPEQTLLHLDHPIWRDLGWDPIDWPALLEALGCRREIRQGGLHFDSYEMVTSAALSGLGIAVAWDHLACDQLDQGLLVRPIPESYRIDRKHYLVSQRARGEEPVIQLLRGWFVEETASFRAAEGSV